MVQALCDMPLHCSDIAALDVIFKGLIYKGEYFIYFQIKTCVKGKEKLEKQLQQQVCFCLPVSCCWM